MYLLYADESGNTGTDYLNKQQPYFVLAGIKVKDSDWHKVNNKFQKEKLKICPEFENYEIHASELFNAPKKSIFNKYSWQENLKILEKIVDLTIDLELSLFYIVLDKKVLKKNISSILSSNIQINPYLFGFSGIYSTFNRFLLNNNDYGIIFCDEMNNISNDLELLYPKLIKENSNIIEKSFYVDSKRSNFIQIADICALYINKYFCITKGNISYNDIKKEHCIKMYNKIISMSGKYNEDEKNQIYNDILNSLK